MKVLAIVATALLVSAGMTTPAIAQQGGEDMTFFLTSTGKGSGADLGGLEGADAHCNALAQAAGSKRTSWKAYLSTWLPGGEAGVNARDRIGKGPWYNAKGVMVAKNLDDLHSDKANVTKETAISEKGQPTKGRGDTTCGNWTKNGEGSAIVGHHDRAGLKDTRHMKSWNSSHGSRGCSQDQLKASGGAGLLYCFAPN